jgi:hypothetical protein
MPSAQNIRGERWDSVSLIIKASFFKTLMLFQMLSSKYENVENSEYGFSTENP